jgi:hypothetical protein
MSTGSLVPARNSGSGVPDLRELFMGHKSHPVRGTGGEFEPQISMNENPSSKYIRNASRLRNVARGKNTGSTPRRQALETKPGSSRGREVFWPARELLISLGWLRLFRTIVSPSYAMAARKEFRHER